MSISFQDQLETFFSKHWNYQDTKLKVLPTMSQPSEFLKHTILMPELLNDTNSSALLNLTRLIEALLLSQVFLARIWGLVVTTKHINRRTRDLNTSNTNPSSKKTVESFSCDCSDYPSKCCEQLVNTVGKFRQISCLTLKLVKKFANMEILSN
ncbi:hypothetical protein JTE90_015953 [Oedothorax gibbosus]|uniref:Uncharacterized protein n=1 Tax=Oedothorax gibbosus TaxID=931172 RepID=A0AAV6U1V5_9ARAC|nr:hypothetical protein JTE90_015953 [Oedothorax gibbosus]